MIDSKEYGCFRYFLVPYEQMSIFQMQVKNRKKLIENIIDNNETSIKIEDNTYEGKYKLYLVNKIDSNNFLLQFGKHTSLKHSEDTGKVFQDSEIDDYPHIYVFINTKEQIILFEKNTKAFSSFNACSKSFSIYISERIKNVGFEFKCKEINSPIYFWNLIDKAKSVKSISLTLYSPNLFGGTTSAEDAARDFKEATNSTENTLTFKNKHGKLSLVKDKFKTFLEYISSGGGSWSIYADIPNCKGKKFSSKQNIKTLNIPNDITEGDSVVLKKFINGSIASINFKPGDDELNEKEDTKKE